MPLKAKRSTTAPQHPEKKYGPFHGGVGVAVWLNQVQTDEGPKFFRSLTIAQRRFRDPKSGDWKDAGSLRTTDLPALVLALQAAHEFMTTSPLPGQPAEEEHQDESPVTDDGATPF